jgi:hypothetical protein
MATDKNGELPLHNPIGFFCWGRSLKIHIKIKSELFMYEINLVVSSFNQCWVVKNHHFQLLKWPRSKLELIFKPKLELKSEFVLFLCRIGPGTQFPSLVLFWWWNWN